MDLKHAWLQAQKTMIPGKELWTNIKLRTRRLLTGGAFVCLHLYNQMTTSLTGKLPVFGLLHLFIQQIFIEYPQGVKHNLGWGRGEGRNQRLNQYDCYTSGAQFDILAGF